MNLISKWTGNFFDFLEIHLSIFDPENSLNMSSFFFDVLENLKLIMDRKQMGYKRQISYLPAMINSMPVCSEKCLLTLTFAMSKIVTDHDPTDAKTAAETFSQLVNHGFVML